MILKSLKKTLTQTLNWQKAAYETFSSLVLGLISQGNVQHHALSLSLLPLAKSFQDRSILTLQED